MNLHNAAKRFDKTVCADAYNLESTFLGQLDLFDDSKRDGATVDRRILSVAADVVIPSRRTITVEGSTWLVGQKNTDSFRGSPIRHKYILHECEQIGLLRTPKQFLTVGGLSLYASTLWVKDNKEADTSSGLYSFVNAYFAKGEAVEVGQLLTLGTETYRIRNVYSSAAGLQIAEANTLSKPSIITITYTAKTDIYNAATDTYTSVVTTFNTIFERFQDSYMFESEAAPKYQEGDKLLTVEKSNVTAGASDKVLINGQNWIVVSVQDAGDCWELQVRLD